MAIASYLFFAYFAGLIFLVLSYAIGNYWYDRSTKASLERFTAKSRISTFFEDAIVHFVIPLIAGVIILSISHNVGRSGEGRAHAAMQACVDEAGNFNEARRCVNLSTKVLIADWYEPPEDYDDRGGF